MANEPDSKFSQDVRQHLFFIENVITRMNSNAFSMKGWMVALVAALCAIYASNSDKSYDYIFFIIAIPVVIIFWCLDAYYLKMERQYRDLYAKIASQKIETDFSMDATVFEQSFCKAMWSKSNRAIYSFVLVLLVLAIIFTV